MLWTTQEVKAWLGFCVEEFALNPVCMDKFNMNGKALCLLLRNDFMERAPHAGDVLFNAFQQLKAQDAGLSSYHSIPVYGTSQPSMTIVSPSYQISPSTSASDTLRLPPCSQSHPCFVPILPQPSKGSVKDVPHANGGMNIDFREECASVPDSMLSPAPTEKYSSDSDSCQNDCGQSPHSLDQSMDNIPTSENEPNFGMNLSATEGECRLLWEFIYQLLQDETYSDLVCWDKSAEQELTFRINKPMELADLWGKQKNRSNMTYEKLSRALRYYYKMNIIHKVQGKKLTYEFLQHPTKIRKGQRGARPHSQRRLSSSTPPLTSGTPCEEMVAAASSESMLQDSPESAVFPQRVIASPGAIPESAVFPQRVIASPGPIQPGIESESQLKSKDSYPSGTSMPSSCIKGVVPPVYVSQTSEPEMKPLSESGRESQLVAYKEYDGKSVESLYKPKSSNSLHRLSFEKEVHSRVDMDTDQPWGRDRSPSSGSKDTPTTPVSVEASFSSYYSSRSSPHSPRSRSPVNLMKSSAHCLPKYSKYPPSSHISHSSSMKGLSAYGQDSVIQSIQQNCALPLSSSKPSPIYNPTTYIQDARNGIGQIRLTEKLKYCDSVTRGYYFSDTLSSEVARNRAPVFGEQDKPEDLSVKKCSFKTE